MNPQRFKVTNSLISFCSKDCLVFFIKASWVLFRISYFLMLFPSISWKALQTWIKQCGGPSMHSSILGRSPFHSTLVRFYRDQPDQLIKYIKNVTLNIFQELIDNTYNLFCLYNSHI